MRSLVLLSLSLSLLVVAGCGNPVDVISSSGMAGSGAGEDDPDSSEDGDDDDGDVTPGDCTLTQGYWKNHEDWPVSDLTLGGVTYEAAELDALLENETEGDASLILSHQLIAARLNEAAGATVPGSVADAMADADAWLVSNADADGRLPFGPAATEGAHVAASGIATELDAFNMGNVGPGHCDGSETDGGDTDGGDDDGGDDGDDGDVVQPMD